jgi:hypothetical protein
MNDEYLSIDELDEEMNDELYYVEI